MTDCARLDSYLFRENVRFSQNKQKNNQSPHKTCAISANIALICPVEPLDVSIGAEDMLDSGLSTILSVNLQHTRLNISRTLERYSLMLSGASGPCDLVECTFSGGCSQHNNTAEMSAWCDVNSYLKSSS